MSDPNNTPNVRVSTKADESSNVAVILFGNNHTVNQAAPQCTPQASLVHNGSDERENLVDKVQRKLKALEKAGEDSPDTAFFRKNMNKFLKTDEPHQIARHLYETGVFKGKIDELIKALQKTNNTKILELIDEIASS